MDFYEILGVGSLRYEDNLLIFIHSIILGPSDFCCHCIFVPGELKLKKIRE